MIKKNTFSYKSSIDGTEPLYADFCYSADKIKKPIIAVMHGYSGSRKAVAKDIADMASYGLFAIAPDMRGHEDSAGKMDSGAVEICDIYDAINYAIENFRDEVDENNVNIVGYSGGGGNAYSAFTKFPDFFNTAVSFFGISDYALWHEIKGRPDCNDIMVDRVGGTPEAVPEKYLARNSIVSALNNPYTKFHIFWDEEETLCPPVLNEKFIEICHSSGYANVVPHVSKKTDKHRWHHGYRTDNPQLKHADKIFVKEIVAGKNPKPKLSRRGSFMVTGYLVTRHFNVWVNDGYEGMVRIEYSIKKSAPEVRVVENPKNHRVRIELH